MRLDFQQFAFIWFILSVVCTAFMIWLFYYCIKCGVRDGIREAMPRNGWRESVAAQKRDDGLPQMHAD